jgi:cell division GTPase FtsZ
MLREAEGADAVFLAAGLGGGTGSSLSQLVETLKDEGLPMVGMMTLPMDSESGIVKVNAVRAINQLVDAPLDGWIFVDNARISKLHQDVSIVDYFAHINGRIAAPLDELNALNEREDLAAIRSFDGEDFRKLLLAGGVLSYNVAQLSRLTSEDILAGVKASLESGDLMPSGFDLSSVAYLGLVLEASEQDLTQVSIGAFEEIEERLKSETQGAALYRGIYRTKTAKERPILRVIASTQSLPHRIREVLSDAQREGLAIRDKLQEQLPTLDLGELENLEFFRPSARGRPSERPRRPRRSQLPIKEKNAMDELQEEIVQPRRPAASKLQKRPINRPNPTSGPTSSPVPTRIPVPGPRKAPAPSVPPVRERSGRENIVPPSERLNNSVPAGISEEETSDGVDLSDLVNMTKVPVGMDLPTEGNAPAAGDYDRLVVDYQRTRDDGARRFIAERLERDGMSPHTVVRYYAVEAMSKLGRETFADALLSATEDENEAVRAMAVEALRR